MNIANEIIIGGGMGYPFLQEIYKKDLGSTPVHLPKDVQILKEIMDKAQSKGVKIHFVKDVHAGT